MYNANVTSLLPYILCGITHFILIKFTFTYWGKKEKRVGDLMGSWFSSICGDDYGLLE